MATAAGPRSDEALARGADNAVAFMGIRPQYRVLIGFTAASDRRAVDAVAAAIRRVGTDPALLEVPPSGLHEPAPAVLERAILGVDYYLDMGAGPGPHSLATYIAMFDYGISMGAISPAPGLLASELAHWPGRLWIELHNCLKRQICGRGPEHDHDVRFRVTDPRGSDLSFRVRCPQDIGAGVGATPLQAGYWGDGERPRVLVRAGFPPSHLPMGDLQHSAEGVLYLDTTNYLGRTAVPLKLTLERGYCTGVEGERAARKLWELGLGRFRNANRLRELAITIHPKLRPRAPAAAPTAPIPRSAFPAAGVGDFVTAFGGDTGVGGVDPGYEHMTTVFATTEGATITADGRTIVDRGRLLLLDDPAVRELARSFGDPDALLWPAATEGAGP